MYNHQTIYIGDIVDLKSCRKENLQEARLTIKKIKEECFGNYVSGNHELDLDKDSFYLVKGDTLFTHGDFIFWGENMALKWRSQSPGLTKFSFFWVWLFNSIIKWRPYFLTNKIKDKIVEAANYYDCEKVIMGHRHPFNKIDTTYKGIRIIVLPRGKNIVDIEEESPQNKILSYFGRRKR